MLIAAVSAANGAPLALAEPGFGLAALGDPVVYLSTTANGSVGGVSFADEDIIAVDTVSGTWSMVFDGSDVGVAASDIDAFDIVSLAPVAVIDLSFEAPRKVNGAGSIDDSDVVRFTGTVGTTTAGTFAMRIDASDIALTSNGEDVDALAATAGGYAFSTFGTFAVPGVSGADEDLVGFTPTTTGPTTSGVYSPMFDGSTVGLSPRNVTGVWIDQISGKVYGTATLGWRINGLTGDGDDVFAFNPATGRATKYFDGDTRGFSYLIDGLHIDPAPTNAAPVITTSAAVSIPEETVAVVDIQTADDTDVDGDGLSYAITGGDDQAAFSVDADTGLVVFAVAPDFETPSDANGDNVFALEVTVTDAGGLSDLIALAVTVLDTVENVPPSILTAETAEVVENTTFVVDVEAIDSVDTEGTGLVYGISGGPDAAAFSVDPGSGVLVLLSAPDYEAPTDVGADRVYDVVVTVTDSGGLTDDVTLSVGVMDVFENTPPLISTGEAVSVPENATAVVDIDTDDATDVEGAGLVYGITGGPDAAAFSVDADSGVLVFVSAPDYEAPTDVGADRVYDVVVTVTDSGGLTDDVTLAVTVMDVFENTPPLISTGEAVSVPEETTAVVDIESTDITDSEGAGLTYGISGGADAAAFSVNTDTGVLVFVSAPEFESPGDVDLDNVYEVEVTVTDSGGLTDDVMLLVRVTDVIENTPPVITTAGAILVAENTVAVVDVDANDVFDTEGAGLVFGISGGADEGLFSVNSDTGVVVFVSAPDFETAIDFGGDGVYEVEVTVTDSGGLTDDVMLLVRVTDVIENTPPVITTAGAILVAENTVAVVDVDANDVFDTEGAGLLFGISGGADEGLFSVNTDTGVVVFVSAPDFETAIDFGGDGVYEVEVTVTDSGGLTDDVMLSVTVTDVIDNTPPVISTAGGVSVAENTVAVVDVEASDVDDVEGAGLTYSVSGGADASAFSIDPDSGVLVFVSAPDFENPTDIGGNHVYSVVVTVTDSGDLSDDLTLAVTVTDVFENTPPLITTSATLSVPSGTAAVVDIESTDVPDAEGAGLTYGITGGADAAAFTVDVNSGVLAFVSAPDFENPTDVDTNNVYEVVVTVTDSGDLSDELTLSVTVIEVAPTWARGVGREGSDSGYGVAVDATGGSLVVGEFTGTVDFDPSPGTTELTSNGGTDLFLTKLDAGGNLVWARHVGGGGADVGRGVAVDAAGGVLVTGQFTGIVDFDPGPGTLNLTSNGIDAFVAMFDSSGSLLWAHKLGGNSSDIGRAVAFDAAGNALVTGQFRNTVDFNPGTGTTTLTSFGLADVFVAKFAANGDFTWALQLGGSANDIGRGVTADADGSVVVTGQFGGTADFKPGQGTVNLVSAGLDDAFVTKLASSGALVWARQFGGVSVDIGFGVAIDAVGSVIVTGQFAGTADFDPSEATLMLASAGLDDVFVTKLDAVGNVVWANGMGGASDDAGYMVAVGAVGSVIVTGQFAETADFDPGPGTTGLTSAGGTDAFVIGLDAGGALVWARGLGGDGADASYGVAVDGGGSTILTGSFQGTADFDPGPAMTTLTSIGLEDVFVTKLDGSGNLT